MDSFEEEDDSILETIDLSDSLSPSAEHLEVRNFWKSKEKNG